MRCSQSRGLPKEAGEFLRNFAEVKDFCRCCGRDDGYVKEQINEPQGFFSDPALFKYTLRDGSTADEYIQREIWDSGPVTWLGLDVGGRKYEWTQDDINTER